MSTFRISSIISGLMYSDIVGLAEYFLVEVDNSSKKAKKMTKIHMVFVLFLC